MTLSQDTTDTLFAIGFAIAAILFTVLVGIMLTIIDVGGFDMMHTIHASAPMMLFRIQAGGVDYGTYEGRDESDALDAFLSDAGYDSCEDLPEHIDPSGFTVTPEKELRNDGARGTILVPVDA